MKRMLYEAAVEGNVTSLLSLIHEDALVLDRFMASCFTDTPLHIASMLAHLEFTMEILHRKPQLAGALDVQRQSPLHVATANGHIEVVKALLLVNPEMCLAQDRHGRNPLYVAVIKGRFEALQALVQAKPGAAVQVSGNQGETILHLCVKHCQFNALKFLVERIDDYDLLNLKDKDGFPALHLAVAL